MATGIPLAEAVVALKLVADKNEIKTNVIKALAPLASIVAAGSLGIRKYLLTTDKGATQLRQSLAGLSRSWNQFLARMGRVIASSGTLQAIFKGLAKVLDSLDDSVIRLILNVATWTAVYNVVQKISKSIAGWKMVSASNVGTAAGAGTAARGISIAGGLVGGAAILKVLKEMFRELAAGRATMIMGFRYLLIALKTRSMPGVGLSMGMFKNSMALGIGGILSALRIAFIVPLLKIVGIVFLAFNVIVGALRGLGIEIKDITSVIGAIGTAFSWLGKAIETLALAIASGMELIVSMTLGVYKKIAQLFGGEDYSFGKDLDEQAKRQRDKFNEIWGKKGDSKWLAQSVSTSSFADLNKAAQDMITMDNLKMATEANTKAIAENTAFWKSRIKEDGIKGTGVVFGFNL